MASPPSSPSLPPADPPAPPSLLPFLPLPSSSAVAFSSFAAVTANPTAFLLRDAIAGSSTNFAAATVSLSLFILATTDDMRVLMALTLLRRRWLRLRLHQPAGPCFLTRRRSYRPRPLPSPLFPSRHLRGRAIGTFFLCFLTASSPLSPLHPRPASSAASFSFDAVLCCRHGLEVTDSLHWSLLRVRMLPPSPLPSRPSTLLSRTHRSSLPPFSSISSAAPRLRHCRRCGENCVDLLRRSLPLQPQHRSLSFLVCGFCLPFNRLRIYYDIFTVV